MAAPSRKLAELFFEIRAKTEGLEKDVAQSTRAFDKLTQFVLRNPVAAIAAVGTAMLGVAVKATQMAAEVERGLTRVKIATGANTSQISQLRAEIETLSKATGRTQAELSAAAALAAKSAGSTAEVGQRLSAALTLSQATGEDLTVILDNLDTVLDVFGLSSEQSADALAKLFAAAKGKQPITDLFDTIKAAGPALVRMGLDVGTATRALTALGEQLGSPKAASAEFKRLSVLGAEGRAEILRLAESVPQATDALKDLTQAANDANNSSDALNARLKNEFSAAMIDLGNKILPLVNAELRGMVGLLDLLSGRAAEAAAQGPLSTVQNLGPLVDKLAEQGKNGAKGIRDLVGAAQDLAKALSSNDLKLPDLNVGELERLGKALRAMIGSDRISQTTKSFLQPILDAVDKLITESPKAAAAVAKVGGFTPALEPRTPPGLASDRIKAEMEARAKAAKDAEELARKLAKLREEELADINKKLDEQVEARKSANEKIFKAQQEATKKLAEMAGDTVGVLKQELAETVEEFKKLGASDSEIDKITQPLQVALTSAQELKGALRFIVVPDDVQKKLADPLKEAKKEAEAAAEALEKAKAATERVANAIADVGNALLSVANALGAVSDKTAAIGRGAINIGTGLLTGNKVQIIGGFADLLNGINAGNAEAEARHADNIAALRAIERHTADLVGKTVAGTALGDAQRGAAAVLAQGQIQIGPNGPEIRGSGAILRGLGLEMEDLKQVASEFGIALDGSLESWLAFLTALKGVDFAAFTDTFAGQMERLEREFEIFGEAFDEPSERFAAFVELLNDPKVGAPALFGILKGLDSATAEGRDAIVKIVQDLFKRAAAGDISAEELGGLNLGQFLDVLSKVIRDLGSAATGATEPVAGLAAALAAAEAATAQELKLRELRATGMEAEADALEQQIANEKELADARAQGLSEETIANIEFVQGLEAAKRAALEAAAAANEAAAAIEAAAAAERRRAQFAESINIEFLDATGQTKEAERARILARHNARVQAAAAAGFNQQTVDQINAILEHDLAEFEQKWAAVVTGVTDALGIDGGAGSAERASISSAAQGLSERTGNRMADYLASMLVLERRQVELLEQIVNGAIATRGALVQPPALSQFAAAMGGGIQTVEGGLTINIGPTTVQVVGSLDDPAALGALIGDAQFQRLAKLVSQQLARDAIAANRSAGNVSVLPS